MDDKEGSKRHKPRRRPLIPRSGEGKAFFLSLILLVILLVMLIMEYVPRAARFEVGKPSTETIISSRDFSVADEETTEKARDTERQRIKSLFIDEDAQAAAVSSLGDYFNKARILAGQEGSLEGRMAQLKQPGDPELDGQVLEYLLTSSDEDSRLLYTAAVELLSAAMSDPVAYDNLDKVREDIKAEAEDLRLDERMRVDAAGLTTAFTKVNTAYSAATINRDMEATAGAVQPVYVHYTVGQKIVDRGELITPLTLTLLGEAGSLSPVGTYQQVLGIGLLLLALYAASLLFFRRFRPKMARNWRIVAMICLVFLVFCLLCRLFAVFADENIMWGYLIPLAMVGLTLATLLDHLVALFVVAMGGIMAGLILKGNFYLVITVLLGGIVGVLLVTHIRHRERLVRAGAELSLAVAGISMITASLIKGLSFIAVAGALGLGNGVMSTLLTLGSFPVLERISGITTPMHLLELASPDHPLMRELITEAPGTYSHSVIVGNLADAAAREIGADALLARVGSYYHDIGKIKRSAFFVENQPRGFDGHKKLKPNLSALIITAHVKEGVDLAGEYHLPEEVTEIIRQHHGTSLIRYFYARALQEGDKTGAVSESRFRYQGEKPQSKEAAVVMLADAIEATAKSLDKPTPVKLDQLTRSLIKERLDDGQLSDSQLTLGDLDKITKAFVRILSAMHHERLEYPTLVKGEGMP